MNPAFRALAVCLIALASEAQQGHPAFEAAGVFPGGPPHSGIQPAGLLRGDVYQFENATIVDLIAAAWAVDRDHVIGGPAWLDSTRFGIIARVPADTNQDSLRLMLQALLADRFHLVVHDDTKAFAHYVLTVGKRLLLKPPLDTGEAGCRPLTNTAANRAMVCRNMTMAQFANRLPRIAGDYFIDNTLADQTGLDGAWDFQLRWTARNSLATPGSGAISIFSALEDQLGLRVAIRDVPAPVIVVDHVSETPTPNPDGVSRNLPGPQQEFEVATVKPSAPGSNERMITDDRALVTFRGFTVRALIKYAWGFQDMDVIDNDDLLAPTPLLSESVRYDITARLAIPGRGLPADLDLIRRALRSLLVERFRLATHTEERPISVYALVASKPRLPKASPANRSGCRLSLLDPAMNVTAAPLFSMSCRNTSMVQLAENLQPWGGVYVRHPVIDATGLTGAWDFTVRWSPPHLLAAAPTADPNGALTLVGALDRQLGLKLRLQKTPVAVLVVDHVESMPSAN
jgi:uncharacterized protein (TIGR03435 family)